jgi:hypothetical protein
MALLKELKGLLPQLSNSKFLAHLLEPVLLWGVLFGVVAWMLSLWVLKNRQAQVCSLILIALSAFCVFPLMHYRTKAKPMTAPSAKLRDDQNQRRRETQWVYYTLGSLAVLGIFTTGEGKGKAGNVVSLGIVFGGLATTVFSLWLHEKEIAVFHEDARRGQRASLPGPVMPPAEAPIPPCSRPLVRVA